MWHVSDLWHSEAESGHLGVCLLGIDQEEALVLVQKKISACCYVTYSKRLSPFNVTSTPAKKVHGNMSNINCHCKLIVLIHRLWGLPDTQWLQSPERSGVTAHSPPFIMNNSKKTKTRTKNQCTSSYKLLLTIPHLPLIGLFQMTPVKPQKHKWEYCHLRWSSPWSAPGIAKHSSMWPWKSLST